MAAEPRKGLSLKEVAALLDLTPRRVQQLASEGWIEKTARGRYPLVQAVQGYIRFLREEHSSDTRVAAENRLRDARAQEVEMRIAERDRRLIDLEEAMDAVDQLSGAFVQSMAGLPARITRNPRERQRIDQICDAERLRLSDRFAEIASALRTGIEATEAGTADDA